MNNNESNFTVTNDNNPAKSKDRGYITYCSRCGAEMYSNSRYCMKCGNLNPDHPDNKGMIKYIEKKGEGYTVGSGQSLTKKGPGVFRSSPSVSIVGENTGNFNLCFAVNMIFYLVIAFGSSFYFYLLARGDLVSIISSNFGEVLLIFSLGFIFLYSFQLLFMKMNRKWWDALIPFYNFYVLADAVIGDTRVKKLTLVPGIGQILWIYILYRLGACFKKPGLLMAFLPFIMIPLTGFDGSAFYGTYYTSGDNRMEDEFKKKRTFLFFGLFFSLLGTFTIVYTNTTHLKSQAGRINAAFMINTANIAIKNVKQKVETDKYTCDFDMDNFYFYFSDVSDYFFVPFSFAHAPVEAYVRVEKVKQGDAVVVGKYRYYISLTDGTNGFAELSSRDLNYDNVVLYDRLEKLYDDGNDCYLHEKS